MPDAVAEQDPKTGRFVSGNIGGGRPKGSRNKLGEQFLEDLQSLWVKEGATCLKEARDEKPMEFAKMVAGLLPKELLVRRAPEEDMTDDEFEDTIAALAGLASQLRERRESDSALN
jgi:hypothetical protein